MKTTVNIWKLLRRVQSLQLKAVTGDRRGFFHRATAAGRVAVTANADDFLTFHETGLWVSTAGQTADFHNVYRWSLSGGDVIRLEHLRYGSDNPVHLVDFTPFAADSMHSIAPHRCGNDRYIARLIRAGECVRLHWKIQGPAKDDILEGVYLTDTQR